MTPTKRLPPPLSIPCLQLEYILIFYLDHNSAIPITLNPSWRYLFHIKSVEMPDRLEYAEEDEGEDIRSNAQAGPSTSTLPLPQPNRPRSIPTQTIASSSLSRPNAGNSDVRTRLEELRRKKRDGIVWEGGSGLGVGSLRGSCMGGKYRYSPFASFFRAYCPSVQKQRSASSSSLLATASASRDHPMAS